MKLKDNHKLGLAKVIKDLDSSFFYYDVDGFKMHIKSMSKIKDDALKLWYACKSNPASAIIDVSEYLSTNFAFPNTNPKTNMSKSKINKMIVDKGLMYFLNCIFE